MFMWMFIEGLYLNTMISGVCSRGLAFTGGSAVKWRKVFLSEFVLLSIYGFGLGMWARNVTKPILVTYGQWAMPYAFSCTDNF